MGLVLEIKKVSRLHIAPNITITKEEYDKLQSGRAILKDGYLLIILHGELQIERSVKSIT